MFLHISISERLKPTSFELLCSVLGGQYSRDRSVFAWMSEWVKHSPVIAKWLCEWTKQAFPLCRKPVNEQNSAFWDVLLHDFLPELLENRHHVITTVKRDIPAPLLSCRAKWGEKKVLFSGDRNLRSRAFKASYIEHRIRSAFQEPMCFPKIAHYNKYVFCGLNLAAFSFPEAKIPFFRYLRLRKHYKSSASYRHTSIGRLTNMFARLDFSLALFQWFRIVVGNTVKSGVFFCDWNVAQEVLLFKPL